MEFLYEYDFEIKYVQGKENVVANALSQQRHEIYIVALEVDLRSQVLTTLSIDSLYQEVKAEIESGKALEGKFAGYLLEFDGLLRYLGHIYMHFDEGLEKLIMSEAHQAPYSAHPGVKKMYVDLCTLYFWAGMKRDIADLVARCLECQRVKAKHQHPVGLLQPHLILEMKWEIISVYFIVGFPMTSRRHDAIIVTIDRLTKVAHFSPIRSYYTASLVARIFMEDIACLHGTP